MNRNSFLENSHPNNSLKNQIHLMKLIVLVFIKIILIMISLKFMIMEIVFEKA